MKIITITIIGMIVMMSLTSAITVIAGSSYSFESEEYEYYTVVGNSSNMEGMEINWEDGNTTINFDLLFKPDNFTLIFFNEKEVIKEVYVGGGGGGSRTIYKDKVIDKIIVREVEKIVEVIDQEEVDRLIGIADKAAKDENTWKLILSVTILLFVVIAIIYFGLKSSSSYEIERRIE